MPQNPPPLPDFTRWPSFPFEGDMRVKALAEPVEVEPPRSGEDAADCVACNTPDDAYIWVSERWRVRGMDRPTGLPMVLILECRSHLDIGDLPNLLAAELGVMTVRLERAIRSLDGVARVHVNRWGDGSAHLHMWFLARPYGRLQLRGTFLSLWDDILPVIPEEQWLENLALVAEWLAGFGGRAIAEPPHIHWQSPSTFSNEPTTTSDTTPAFNTSHPTDATDSPSAGFTWNSATPDLPATDVPTAGAAAFPDLDPATGSASTGSASGSLSTDGSASADPDSDESGPGGSAPAISASGNTASGTAHRGDLTAVNAETRDLSSYAIRAAGPAGPAPSSTTAPTAEAGNEAAMAPAHDNEPTANGSNSSVETSSPAEVSSVEVSRVEASRTEASRVGVSSVEGPATEAPAGNTPAGNTIPSQHDRRTAEVPNNPEPHPSEPQSPTAPDNPTTPHAAPSH